MRYTFVYKIISQICFILCLAPLSYGRSGGIVGNGADDVVKAQAWFLGEAPVKVCVETVPGFPVGAREAREVIQKGFSNWRNYTDNKKLRSQWPSNAAYLDFNLQWLDSCDGKEDIAFFLGVLNDRVRSAVKQYQNPKAFNQLESFDPAKGRGKGYVWVSHDRDWESLFWRPTQQLHMLLMHEIGHVLGCDHVAGTIMREDLAKFVREASPINLTPAEVSSFPNSIDQARELFFAPARGVSALQSIVVNPTTAQKELFKKILRREISGALWMGFHQGDANESNRGTLFIGDESGDLKPQPVRHLYPSVETAKPHLQLRKLRGGAFNINFDMGSLIDFSSSDSRVFRFVLGDRDTSFPVPGFLLQGNLIINKTTGENVPFTYARNRGSDEYVRLLFRSETGSQEFFRAFLFGQPYW